MDVEKTDLWIWYCDNCGNRNEIYNWPSEGEEYVCSDCDKIGTVENVD